MDSSSLGGGMDGLATFATQQAVSGNPVFMKLKGAKSPEMVDKAAKEFESFFLSQMLDQISSGISSDGMFGGGHAEKVFKGLLNQEYGKAIAQSGGVGIADMVKVEMLRMQEQASQ